MRFAGPIVGRAQKRIWTPYQLGRDRLRLWLDADDYSRRMVDDGAGLISSWTDRIAGLAFTGTTTARPTYSPTGFNGAYPAVTGDGVANTLANSSIAAALPNGDYEIWAVCAPVAGSAIGMIFAFGGTGAGTIRQLRRDAANRISLSDGSTLLSGTTANTFVGPHIARVYFSGTTMGFARDAGASSGSTTFANTAIGATRARIFASTAATPANFVAVALNALLVIRTGSLSTSEREYLEQWCALKVDGQLLLPTTHRYYFGPVAADTASVPVLPAYFTPANAAAAAADGWSVWMATATPPTSDAADETTYAYWPNTDVASQSLDLVNSSTWSGRRWPFLFAERYNGGHNNRASPIFPTITYNGKQCRTEFSSIDKAIASTTVRWMYVLGYSASEYNAVADAAGFNHATDILTRSTLAASPGTYFTQASLAGPGLWNVMVDKIWLPDTVPSSSKYSGLVIDYEPQDGRSVSQTTAHVQNLASLAHAKGKQIIFYSNPYTGVMGPYNGWDDDSLPVLAAAVDYMGIEITGSVTAATDYAAQKALIGGTSKALVVLDLNAALAEVQALRIAMLADGLKRVWFFPNGVTVGSNNSALPANRSINAMVFGV